MKQSVRYQVLTISNKIRVEIRITVDDVRNPEFISNVNADKSVSINLFPLISISLIRATELDENGNRGKAPWNRNDILGMTKYTLPIFLRELIGLQHDLKTPELYTYTGKRLELNEAIAAKIRRVFMIGNTTLELSPVVIMQQDESRVEGIKMKFNNEQSSVLLTLNDVESLSMNLKLANIDTLVLLMYLNYITKPTVKPYTPSTLGVDIALPKDELPI